MKYITHVNQENDVKHIVEVDGKNVEVIQTHKPNDYGNRKGERAFLANGLKVSKDLHFNNSLQGGSDYIHLVQVVLAIELVRFVINHLEAKS